MNQEVPLNPDQQLSSNEVGPRAASSRRGESLPKISAVQWTTLAIVLTAHFIVVQAILLQINWTVSTSFLSLWFTFPVSQLALVMVWCGPSHRRLLVGAPLGIAIWYLLIHCLKLSTFPLGAAYVFAGLFADAVTILLVFHFLRWRNSKERHLRFGIFSVLVVTSCIGLVLALVRHWEWSPAIAAAPEFWLFPIYGVGWGTVGMATATFVLTVRKRDADTHFGKQLIKLIGCVLAAALLLPILLVPLWPSTVWMSVIYAKTVVWEAIVVGLTVVAVPWVFECSN